MGVAAKYNRGGKWDTPLPKDLTYVKLSDIHDIHLVKGIYFSTKSKFGKSVSVYDGDVMINLPSHMVKICEEMVEDMEVITAISESKLGIEPYSYELAAYPGKTFVGARWVDM